MLEKLYHSQNFGVVYGHTGRDQDELGARLRSTDCFLGGGQSVVVVFRRESDIW